MANFGIGEVVVDWIHMAQDTVTYHRTLSLVLTVNVFLGYHSEILPGRIVGSYVVTNGGNGVLLKVVSTSQQVIVALLRTSYCDPRATRIAS